MGTWAKFEEKEFETLCNASLLLRSRNQPGRPRIFSPGQALEKKVGFDFSMYLDPNEKVYRSLFGPSAATRAVQAAPHNQLTPTARRPTSSCSTNGQSASPRRTG